MDQSKWPHNPESTKVDKLIAWKYANPTAYSHMTVKMVKEIDVTDLNKLVLDQGYREVFKAHAPREVVAAVTAKVSGRPIETPAQAAPRTAKENIKDELRDELNRVNVAAMDNDNLTAQIQIIKLRAELESLLNKKEVEEDRVITINVITGIDRAG